MPNSYSRTSSSRFIGREDSRRVPLTALEELLATEKASGLVSISGIAGIGKTSVIEEARNANERNGSLSVEDIVNLDEPIDLSEFVCIIGICLKEKDKHGEVPNLFTGNNFNPEEDVKRKPGETRGEYRTRLLGILRGYVKKLYKLFKDLGQSALIIYVHLNAKFVDGVAETAVDCIKSGINVKLIVEHRTLKGKKVQSPKPVLIPKSSYRYSCDLGGFSDEEVNECLGDWLEATLTRAHFFSAIVDALKHSCGKHPSLLRQFCQIVNSTMIDLEDQYDQTGSLRQCLGERLSISDCVEMAREIVPTLSEDAQEAIRRDRYNSDLEHYGLLCEKVPIMILKRYLKSNQRKKSSSDMNKGGTTMVLGETIVSWAVSQALTHGRDSLKKIWRKTYSPTPLYLKALEKATKEVTKSWKAQGLETPKLNIDKAIDPALSKKVLDESMIKKMPSVSNEDIKNALIKSTSGGGSKDNFVQEIIKKTEELFKKAITLDEKHETMLWKEYMIELAEITGEKQGQILQKISEETKMLRFLLNDNEGEIMTIKEMCGDGQTEEGVKTQNLPSPSIDLEQLNEAELEDKYNYAISSWYMARESKEDYMNTINKIERKIPLPAGLSIFDTKKLNNARKEYKKNCEKMDLAKANLNTLTKRAYDLFG